ncbi:hypothetical protein [Streptomyces candidus]|uniref:Uncharacterized protein n=1 Tax=Streptomyces candidus TaxID=67283 RepID=A0A7X0HJH5_9ACTN|nr:hypothetical protein [Streptomyces candidus]MBB6438618.1 hypothetical protein [Streptomyces candidus]GHH45300.1 hypothetical protein GCM10018773_34340 [Streptomyces candidus]
MTTPLSCYSTALVDHLGPGAADRLADAVHLWVRTDAPDGTLAFSHHDRIDPGLAYADAEDWTTASRALGEQLARYASVIVVGNAFHLPWSPHHDERPVAHWFLLRGRRDDAWDVTDGFTALMPGGEQRPFEGTLGDAELCRAMTPLGRQAPHLHHRDVYALGVPTHVGDPDRYRWLRPAGGAETDWSGEWLRELPEVLEALRDRFVRDEQALHQHADDLWAAARHHEHALTRHGDPEAAAAWAQLPKALRFASESARRGRHRGGVVAEAFDTLIELTTRTVERHDQP